jgi:2-oxoisovalerate dehydrogenase E1 component
MSNQTTAKKVDIDWKRVTRLLLLSRTIDDIEEKELVPDKKVLYQFSARGHELAQILLGLHLTNPKDVVSAYYRSRPLMLTLGLSAEDAIASGMAKSGGYSSGRDIGVVCNMPNKNGPMVLPLAGDVGSQYTPGAGIAQAIQLLSKSGKDQYECAISVICGGDGSVATNGFWSALTMATTLNLPVLFFIEDNGYGISVEGSYQTPGGNIANNLYSFKSGTDPEQTSEIIQDSIEYVRNHQGPALLRLRVPRINGHSYQDNQAYKAEELLKKEQDNDPLKKLKTYLIPKFLSEQVWKEQEKQTKEVVEEAAEQAWNLASPSRVHLEKALYSDGMEVQKVGGLFSSDYEFPKTTTEPRSAKQRLNMVEAIRRTLEHELEINDKVLVFGEDVGRKGGVHAVTSGLQTKFGAHRVFDTSLSEEGIIGRAVGLAYAGFLPIAEIQFRKYADPATEQLKNAGTIRWRTSNRFAAPMVVRMPGGFAKCGDPWHSESNESFLRK